MMSKLSIITPTTDADLLKLCQTIQGLTFLQLAALAEVTIPESPSQRKGWVGMVVEKVLGASAGNRAEPDFHHLGIELKTIPLNQHGKPAESTFITSIPLLTIHQQQWATSQCYQKLRRVLWVPVEGDKIIPFTERRIGQAHLWSPNDEQALILENDWTELVMMIGMGRLEEVDAHHGEYLQIRPKASNGRALCYGFDEEGNKILTLPRGFYLRSRFTATLF